MILLALVLASCGRKESALAHAERVCGREWEKRGYTDVVMQSGGSTRNDALAEMRYTATRDGMTHDLQCWVIDRKIRELSEDMRVLPLE